jgi:hypothetical protein
MLNQFKHAVRLLRKNPVFASTAIITISLGIGASAAIFSVTNAVLLEPLPYKDADRLIVATGELLKRGVSDLPLSNPDFIDLRSGANAEFEDFAAVRTGRMLLPKTDGTLERVRFASVTPNFFRLMGEKIIIGRDFVDADAQIESQAQPQVAIVTYEYWQRRYGGDRAMF